MPYCRRIHSDKNGVNQAFGHSGSKSLISHSFTFRAAMLVTAAILFATNVAAAERPDFATWQAKLWPEAQQFGIRRATFDAAFKGLKPDRKLPDLDIPRKSKPKGQAEFNRPPQNYVREKTIAQLAARGRKLAKTHATTLARIKEQFGVPPSVVLAIWGRETAFGGYRLRHDAIRALATQAYLGNRPELFRRELLFALKMLNDGVVSRSRFRSSWAGAFGLTQFMPSEYETLAVDLDGDGHKNVWSVTDALASAANQLKQKGWLSDRPWGYEVVLPVYRAPSPNNVTCAEDGPLRQRFIAAWHERGVRRVANRAFKPEVMQHKAFLFSPGGGMGPVFLATENFLVFKRYNLSDLYALFVGHLADRISGSGRFVRGWGKIKQLPRDQIASIQTVLKNKSFPIGKIDGRIGPNTRSQIGQYQLRNGLPVDCWPSVKLLRYMRRAPSSAKQ